MASHELLTRAVEEVVPQELAVEKLKSGKKLRVYLGIDPTGSKLHLGHTVPLRKLQAFAEAGHEAIFLVGSFTAMVGDPTGRDTQRSMLTKEEVKKNFETYKEQASKILDFTKVKVVYNHEWLEKLGLRDLMKLASVFTIQQMMHRDMFRERMKKEEDLSPNEFLYPIMQGYDSAHLDVDFEIGGNDQLFNMLCGRKLHKALGKRDKCVLTTRLIEGTDGRKMSKTYENCVYLEDEPQDMYGKLMSIRDNLITTYFECCTDVKAADIKEIADAMKSGDNPKPFKMRLAKEIMTMYHGKKAAEGAEAQFTKVFADKGVPDDMPAIKVKKGALLVDVLAEHDIVPSKSEARRLIRQKGIHMNDKVVEDLLVKVGEGLTAEALAKGVIVKVGKRRFVRIVY